MKTQGQLKFLYLFILITSLTSCGTLLLPKHKKSLTLESSIPASVQEGDYKLGTIPYKVGTNVKTNIPLTIKADGYRDVHIYIGPSNNRLFEFLDILGLGIPLYIDAATGGLKQFKEKSIRVSLYKKFTEVEVGAVINEIKWQLREGEKLGFSKDKIKFNFNKFRSYDIFSNIISNEPKSRIDVLNFKKGYINYEYKSKSNICLQPEISNLSFKKNGILYQCTSQITWNVIKNDSLLLIITNKFSYTDNKGGIPGLLEGMLTESWYSLQENEELIKIIKSNSSTSYLESKFSDTLTIDNKFYKKEGKRSQKMAQATKAVVTIKTDEGFGSGFFINSEGYIITNHHVVDKQQTVDVTTSDNKQFKATVIRSHEEADLCLLKINDTTSFQYLSLNFSGSTVIGDEVYAIGTPEDLKLSQTLTRGILSAIRKDETGREYLQSDVSINSGNSGGPLLNEEAEVIGINTSKVKKAGVQGLSFSIPIQQITKYLLIKIVK